MGLSFAELTSFKKSCVGGSAPGVTPLPFPHRHCTSIWLLEKPSKGDKLSFSSIRVTQDNVVCVCVCVCDKVIELNPSLSNT